MKSKPRSGSRGAGRRPVGRASGGGRRFRLALGFNLLLLAVLGVWFAFQPPARREDVTRLVANALKREKRIDLADVAWDIWQFCYSSDFVAAPPAPGDHTHVIAGLPRADASDRSYRLLSNRAYLVGYGEDLGNPLWAAYRTADIDLPENPPPRPDRFETDPRTAARIRPEDYSNSGYDRGHLAPNHAIATRHGEAAQRETFLMSNVIPQRHALNAGPWKRLEMKIATSYPARFGEVWVLAGPVFAAKPRSLPGGVAIPEACYMIVLDESDGRLRAEAFLFPQDTAAEADPARHLTTIDEIERRTGLDFLSELKDAAESALESRRASRVW